MSKIITTIRALVKGGMKILPLQTKSKAPIAGGGVFSATGDLEVLKRFFVAHPDANYGIATGQVSKLVVLDVDGEDGRESLRQLVNEHGKLPKTVVVKTGRGKHYWFRTGKSTFRNSAGQIGKGIDVRGDRGYIVGPGSVHETGIEYRFLSGRSPTDIEIAKAPKWLRVASASTEISQPRTIMFAVPFSQIERAKAYIDSALSRELERLGKAPKHQRNETLNGCAFKLGQLECYGLDRAAVVRQLKEVAKRTGLEDCEIGPTIKSGLDAGSKHPRSLPFLQRSPVQECVEGESKTIDTELTKELSKLGETDTDNAQRLAARFAHRIIYAAGRGWLVYKKGRWLPGAHPECIELAKATARQIAAETQYLSADQAKAARRAQFAQASLSKGALDRMLDLTKGLVEADDTQLDADPWLFNAANGTIDLRTGYIEPHDPGDLLTQISPVVADRDAKCPNFRKFLKRVTNNDKKLMRYIRSSVGYTLTGETKEQIFFFCYGQSGSNGKSTLVNLIRDMMGDYGRHTPTETLMTKQYDNAISNDQARLAGVRMVTAVETNFNRQLDEAKIKAMTGGEKITARFMRAEFFEFTPTFKLWLVANDRPRVRGTDTALWRRIRVIPFDAVIPENQQNKNLPAQLREEWPGILSWAVRGCIDWQKNGLKPPEAILTASQDWAKAADHLKRFVTETLIEGQGNRIPAAALYGNYETWCRSTGETALSTSKFKQALITAHNVTHKRTKKGSSWIDVKYRM